LAFQNVILWGANNYCQRLPQGGWIVWDKRLSEAADKMLGSPFELAWSSHRRLFKIIRVLHGGAKNADALNGDVANEARFHPTQKPIRVMQQCVEFFLSSETILDPFMGSGTTGVACAKLGRKFIGIEIEPKYFDIACKRIEEAYAQPDMFIEQPRAAEQLSLADGYDAAANSKGCYDVAIDALRRRHESERK
jgi:site-specific DNA-methyltransferase (adenine-specific)/modification methylase